MPSFSLVPLNGAQTAAALAGFSISEVSPYPAGRSND